MYYQIIAKLFIYHFINQVLQRTNWLGAGLLRYVGHMPNLVGYRYSLKRAVIHSLTEILEEVDSWKIHDNVVNVSIRLYEREIGDNECLNFQEKKATVVNNEDEEMNIYWLCNFPMCLHACVLVDRSASLSVIKLHLHFPRGAHVIFSLLQVWVGRRKSARHCFNCP